MGGSACPFGRFSGIAADPSVFFLGKNQGGGFGEVR